jgi:hypothetical protein
MRPVLITTDPFTRINDQFLDGTIDCEYPQHEIRHQLLHDNFPTLVRERWTKGNDHYKHIALDIAVETVFDYPYPYITEKTLRPIFMQRMYIVVGAAGTLEILRQQGFYTWGDFIDESYDQIKDPCDRFRAVMKSIRDFCVLDLEDIKKYLCDNQYKLQHNVENLQNLRNRELDLYKKTLKI